MLTEQTNKHKHAYTDANKNIIAPPSILVGGSGTFLYVFMEHKMSDRVFTLSLCLTGLHCVPTSCPPHLQLLLLIQPVPVVRSQSQRLQRIILPAGWHNPPSACQTPSRAQPAKVQNAVRSGRAQRDWLLSSAWQTLQERDLFYAIH